MSLENAAAVVRRIAVIGDIHTHDGRLAVALREIAGLNVECVFCTGDVVDGPGSAAECCSLIRAHGVRCVRGNHDRWLFTSVWRDQQCATALDSLSPDDQEFLRTLPPVCEVRIPQGLMLLCHGIGDEDLEAIRRVAPEYFIATNKALATVRETKRYRLMVSGHTHERLVVAAGELLLVNVGTLGGTAEPGFAVFDFDANALAWCDIEGETIRRHDPVVLFAEGS